MSRAVLAIGAHPDDIEFLMSGTLMLLGAAGFEMHYLNIANGSLGTVQYDTPTIVAMRRDEAAKAAASIGATYYESVCATWRSFTIEPHWPAWGASCVRSSRISS